MEISFENFGKAGSGTLKLHDLTIICGPNNSGKTYLSYAIYGCLSEFSLLFDYGFSDDLIRDLGTGKPITIDLAPLASKLDELLIEAGRKFSRRLKSVFNAPDDFFSGTDFRILIEKGALESGHAFNGVARLNTSTSVAFEKLPESNELTAIVQKEGESRIPNSVLRELVNRAASDAIFGAAVPQPFVVTSERTGASLFYKELDINKNSILAHLAEAKSIDPIRLLNSMQSRYAQPIKDNIDTIRDFPNISKKKSFLARDKDRYSSVLSLLSELLGGTFKDNDGEIIFTSKKIGRSKGVSAPFWISSSSAKSLFLVDMYIRHMAQVGEILIIDEPELNLHPDNQVKMARLVARLVNSGVKVLVTTHSDYFVREINNLIAASRLSDDNGILSKHQITASDMLPQEKVGAYVTGGKNGVTKVNVDESGIDTKIFDTIIERENRKSQEIFYAVEG